LVCGLVFYVLFGFAFRGEDDSKTLQSISSPDMFFQILNKNMSV